jgi:hypothetical protein
MKKIAAIFAILMASAAASATEGHPGQENHGKRQDKPSKPEKPLKPARPSTSATSSASAASLSAAASYSSAAGGSVSGVSALGGAATGGQVIVSNVGTGSGITGRMVPDVSTTAPLTSTSCRNGINAGASGSGWGGLLGFFTEDEICELRLLWEQFRAAGMHDKADKLLDGMMMMRCEKMAPDQRKLFGDLCPKQPAQEGQNAAFSSAG